MFKEITEENITAAETKKRILAYAYCQVDPKLSSDQYWDGSNDTYLLNLRLSGIYGNQPLQSNLDHDDIDNTDQVSSLKYRYLTSARFIQSTQNLNSQEFIECVYQTFLGRKVDQGGFTSNLQDLQNGRSRLKIVNVIRNSPEAQNFFLSLTDCLNDQYFYLLAKQIYLNTSYSDLQFTENINSVPREISRQQIIQDLQQFQKLQSALKEREQDFGRTDDSVVHNSKTKTNEDFIKQLYKIYLKREADIDGLHNQIRQLESDTDRSKVLYNLRTSTEAINMFVKLTAHLNNITFVELAYRIYHKAELSSTQKQSDLEKLESGFSRQTILSAHNFELSNQQQTASSRSINKNSQLNPENEISIGDRQIILQKWQVKNAEFIQQTTNLDNSEFIAQIYQFFLQRQVTEAEFELHQQQFTQAISRLDLLNQVRKSKQAANLLIQAAQNLDNEQFLDIAYALYFQKQLDPADKLVYLQFLNRGNPRADILD